jgi:hypothetical protein
MIRHATAVWNGTGKEGNGHLTTQSTVLTDTQYSYLSRFERRRRYKPRRAGSGCTCRLF